MTTAITKDRCGDYNGCPAIGKGDADAAGDSSYRRRRPIEKILEFINIFFVDKFGMLAYISAKQCITMLFVPEYGKGGGIHQTI